MRSFALFVALLASAATAEQEVHFLGSMALTSTDADATPSAGVDLLGAHYGSPASGCGSDETMLRISGVPGAVCAPKCTDTNCPTDVPTGVTAQPQCALSDPSTGDKYCILLCKPAEESFLRAGVSGGMCGDATCQPVQGAGVCTYGQR